MSRNFLITDPNAPLTYQATKWERYLHEARANTDGALRDAHRTVAGALTDANRNGGDKMDGDTADAIDTTTATFAGEVFSRLYGNPDRIEQPNGGWATHAQSMLDEMPEWQSLRDAVAGDPDFSALAAAQVMNAIAPGLADMIDENDNGDDGDGQPGDGQPGDGPGNGPGGPGNGPGNGLPDATARVRAAMRRAVRDASDDVAETRSAMAGLAPGLEHKPAAHEQHDPARMTLAEQLRSDPRLRDMLDRAGRVERMSAANDAQKCDGSEEVVDIERGGDVSRLIPAELARIASGGVIELLALRDLVERKALCYRYEGTQAVGRGDLIVLLDESASMGGDPHMWARAIGIASVSVAAREQRGITVIGFDTRVRSVHRMTADGVATIDDTPVRGVADMVMSIARQSLGGGTDLGGILETAIDMITGDDGTVSERADVLIVTDGCDTIADATIERITDARAEQGVRVFGLTVNGGSLSETLAAACVGVVDIDAADDVAASIANMGWSA